MRAAHCRAHKAASCKAVKRSPEALELDKIVSEFENRFHANIRLHVEPNSAWRFGSAVSTRARCAQAVWLLGGQPEDADALVQRVPALQVAAGAPKAVAIPLETVSAAHNSWLGLQDGSPSTGFVGAALKSTFFFAGAALCLHTLALPNCCPGTGFSCKSPSVAPARLSALRACRGAGCRTCFGRCRYEHGPHLQLACPAKAGTQTSMGCGLASAGIKAVLHCAAPAVVVHLFGMNWHEKNWRGHKVRQQRLHAGTSSLGKSPLLV